MSAMSEHEPALNPDFAYCLKKFGLPISGEAVPPEVIAAYAGRTPSSLHDFWKQCGVGLWLDGRFQLCRPDRYQPILDMILANDPDFPPAESTLLGFTAFGRLLIWHNKQYLLTIDLVNKVAYTEHLSPKHPILPPDLSVGLDLSFVDDPSYDFLEHTDDAKPLFAQALKKLGPLAFGECYGFFPAMGLGGLGVLSELRRVRALERFAIIAQLDPIELRFNDLVKKRVVRLRNLGG